MTKFARTEPPPGFHKYFGTAHVILTLLGSKCLGHWKPKGRMKFRASIRFALIMCLYCP